MKNKLVAPFVKWVGGKRQLLGVLSELLPSEGIKSYCEPFIGGGAMLFHLQPDVAYVNDINSELINVYRVVKHSVEGLIYEVRSWDRDKAKYITLPEIQRVERIM